MQIRKGPPYFFLCRQCGHRFQLRTPIAFLCPQCRSLRIETDHSMKK